MNKWLSGGLSCTDAIWFIDNNKPEVINDNKNKSVWFEIFTETCIFLKEYVVVLCWFCCWERITDIEKRCSIYQGTKSDLSNVITKKTTKMRMSHCIPKENIKSLWPETCITTSGSNFLSQWVSLFLNGPQTLWFSLPSCISPKTREGVVEIYDRMKQPYICVCFPACVINVPECVCFELSIQRGGKKIQLGVSTADRQPEGRDASVSIKLSYI